MGHKTLRNYKVYKNLKIINSNKMEINLLELPPSVK